MTGIARLRLAATIVCVAGALGCTALPAQARKLHHPRSHHPKQARVVSPPAVLEADGNARPQIPYAYSFYPHEIEGGVSGNLPFNNQIRKFRDPLNANGAGG